MSRREGDLWKRFRDDWKLLADHKVTEQELAFLEKVEMFGSLKSIADMLFVLKNVRQSGGSPASK